MHRLSTRLLFAATAMLLLLPATAAAQTAPDIKPAVPPCMPLVSGVIAKMPRHVRGALGDHYYWSCRVGAARAWEGVSTTNGLWHPSAVAWFLREISAANDRKAMAEYLWRQHVTFSCARVLAEATERGALCRERAAIYQAHKVEWNE